MNENHDVLAECSSVVSCIGGYELWFRTTSLRFLGGVNTDIQGESHMHTMYDIHWVTKGSFLICCNGETLRVTPDTVVIIPPNLMHGTMADPDSPVPCARGSFKISFVRSDARHPAQTAGADSFERIVRTFSAISRPVAIADMFGALALVQTMYQEMSRQEFGCYQLLQAAIIAFVTLLAKSILQTRLPEKLQEVCVSGMRQELIQEYFISKHVEAANAQELADLLDISIRQLNRILKETYGMTFRQKLAWHRLFKAKRLLQTTTCTLSEIAEQCGYSSASSLSRAFRNYEGWTIGEMRRSGRLSRSTASDE